MFWGPFLVEICLYRTCTALLRLRIIHTNFQGNRTEKIWLRLEDMVMRPRAVLITALVILLSTSCAERDSAGEANGETCMLRAC